MMRRQISRLYLPPADLARVDARGNEGEAILVIHQVAFCARADYVPAFARDAVEVEQLKGGLHE